MSALDPKRTLVSVQQAAPELAPAHYQRINSTRYNALSRPWGRYEAPFRWRPQSRGAKAPQCAKGQAQPRCRHCRAGNGRRPAYPRARRGAATGNCELRDFTTYFKVARRPGISISNNTGGRHSHLQCQLRKPISLRRRKLLPGGRVQYACGIARSDNATRAI